MVRHARVLGTRRPRRWCRFGRRDGLTGRAPATRGRAGAPARPAAGLRALSCAVAIAVLAVLPGGAPSLAAGGPATIRALSVEPGATGPVLHVATTGRLDVVHYSPQPGVWVVEAPADAFAGDVPAVSAPDAGVRRAEVTLAEEYGKALTRLTVWLERPATAELVERDDGFDLVFAAPDAPPATSAAVSVEPVEPAAAPGPESAPAGNLYRVVPEVGDGGVVVRLEGDGRLAGRTFTLPDPPRVVLDLPGVVCRTRRHVLPVGAAGVRRVRVAQHRAVPEPVTRVVVDLDDATLADTAAFEPRGDHCGCRGSGPGRPPGPEK